MSEKIMPEIYDQSDVLNKCVIYKYKIKIKTNIFC